MNRKWNGKKRIVWSQALAEKVIRLKAEGMKPIQIAESMGVSDQTIYSFFNRLKTDKTFYLAGEKEKRQVIRKERIKALAAKPKLPAQTKGDLIAKVDDAIPPLGMARIWLGKRFVETDKGFYLDGREVGLNAVMRATNSILLARGSLQVTNNPAWRVEP